MTAAVALRPRVVIDNAALPPGMTVLATAVHPGCEIRGGRHRDDAAVTSLLRSHSGDYFLYRVISAGCIAAPDRAGKRRIESAGMHGLSRRAAAKWLRRHG